MSENTWNRAISIACHLSRAPEAAPPNCNGTPSLPELRRLPMTRADDTRSGSTALAPCEHGAYGFSELPRTRPTFLLPLLPLLGRDCGWWQEKMRVIDERCRYYYRFFHLHIARCALFCALLLMTNGHARSRAY